MVHGMPSETPHPPIDRARTTVSIDQRLLRAAKTVAAATGRSDSEVIEEALHDYLAGPQAELLLQSLSEVMNTLGSANLLGPAEGSIRSEASPSVGR